MYSVSLSKHIATGTTKDFLHKVELLGLYTPLPSLMATPSRLLLIAPEIRQRIYSFILINEFVIDIIAADVTCRREYGLFLACRQLHDEASGYYYAFNAFQLSLGDPIYSPDAYLNGSLTLKRRLGRMRNLHVELGPVRGLYASDNADEDFTPEFHEQTVRWKRFVEQLTATHSDSTGYLLKSLVIVDRSSHSQILSHCLDETGDEAPETISQFEDNVTTLTDFMEPFKDRVAKLTVEIRYGYDWTPYVSIDDQLGRLIMSSCFASQDQVASDFTLIPTSQLSTESHKSSLHRHYTHRMNLLAQKEEDNWCWRPQQWKRLHRTRSLP